MTLIQFLTRVTEKVAQMDMPDDLDPKTGVRLSSDRSVTLSHLGLCRQIAAHKGGPHWNPPNKNFKLSWDQILKLILKHDPKFFEEFKDDDQARAELKEILGV